MSSEIYLCLLMQPINCVKFSSLVMSGLTDVDRYKIRIQVGAWPGFPQLILFENSQNIPELNRSIKFLKWTRNPCNSHSVQMWRSRVSVNWRFISITVRCSTQLSTLPQQLSLPSFSLLYLMSQTPYLQYKDTCRRSLRKILSAIRP